MPVANFRFYAELNDFLAPERRFTEFAYGFLDVATVKDRIESFGVPHTEVDLILVNGQSVDFAYRVQDGDRISVYPVFEAFDIAGLARLRPEPLRDPRFVLDVHLGRLAAYLRMLGFDTLYQNRCADECLAEVSRSRTADSVDPRCGSSQTRLRDARILPPGNSTAAATPRSGQAF